METLNKASLPDELIQRVSGLILVTRHALPPKDFDAQILADIDLSILGESEERFEQYENGIRKEYESVPEEVYRRERARVLKSFLDWRNIFSTQVFHAKYEKQARVNVNKLLQTISSLS